MMPLAQAPSPEKRTLVPKPYLNLGIVTLGVVLSTVGYYNRKTDLGTIAVGAGSSIVGAGIVLLILDVAGFQSSAP